MDKNAKPLSWLALEGGNPDTNAGRCSPTPAEGIYFIIRVEAINLLELEMKARELLPQTAYDYYASGANNENTLRENSRPLKCQNKHRFGNVYVLSPLQLRASTLRSIWPQ